MDVLIMPNASGVAASAEVQFSAIPSAHDPFICSYKIAKRSWASAMKVISAEFTKYDGADVDMWSRT